MSNKKELVNAILRALEEDESMKRAYERTIEPIILNLEKDDNDKFINRFAYTIIDQRRDVENIVIPIWISFLSTNLTPSKIQELFRKEKDAEILLKSLFKAILTVYGHELKLEENEIEKLVDEKFYRQKVASRVEALLKCYKYLVLWDLFLEEWRKETGEEETAKNFKEFIAKNRIRLIKDGKLLNKLAKIFPMIAAKSILFFLRDVEPCPEDPDEVAIPIDVNVARAIQMTGIHHKDVIPLEKASSPKEMKMLQESLREAATENIEDRKMQAKRIIKLDRGLFVLGMLYCQKCTEKEAKCPHTIKNLCRFHNMKLHVKSIFLKQLRGEKR